MQQHRLSRAQQPVSSAVYSGKLWLAAKVRRAAVPRHPLLLHISKGWTVSRAGLRSPLGLQTQEHSGDGCAQPHGAHLGQLPRLKPSCGRGRGSSAEAPLVSACRLVTGSSPSASTFVWSMCAPPAAERSS